MDGRLVAFNRAQVHLMSHSFCRGSAVFEVMSLHEAASGPAVFRLNDHLQRLRRSAELIHMKLPMSAARLKAAVKETVQANRLREGMVKLICYYGGVEFEVVPRNPRVTVAVVAVDPQKDLSADRFSKSLRQPATATVSRWRKLDPRTVPVECKCAANYLGGMVAKLEAMEAGFNSPILLDLKGNVAEGATESLFIVKDGRLLTPPLDNILSGITRKSVIELSREIGISVREQRLQKKDLMSADEAFFTSSVIKTWPISKIDRRRMDAPGQITRLLDRAFEKILAGKVKSYRKWLVPVK